MMDYMGFQRDMLELKKWDKLNLLFPLWFNSSNGTIFHGHYLLEGGQG